MRDQLRLDIAVPDAPRPESPGRRRGGPKRPAPAQPEVEVELTLFGTAYEEVVADPKASTGDRSPTPGAEVEQQQVPAQQAEGAPTPAGPTNPAPSGNGPSSAGPQGVTDLPAELGVAAPASRRKRKPKVEEGQMALTDTKLTAPKDPEKSEEEAAQPLLFEFIPNIDIHLHSADEAVAEIAGPEPDRTMAWIAKLTSGTRQLRSRRVAFPTRNLDRFLCIRQPSRVTLDAAALCVARAIWADALGWKPLQVTRVGKRLVANSPRWPSGWRVVDAPWSAIAALEHLGIRYDVDERAKALLTRKLADSGQTIAEAGLAGPSALIEARNPSLLHSLQLPALAYVGSSETGRYRLPLLAAEPLLREPSIAVTDELAKAIRKAHAPIKPLETSEGFPWTLYGFQARDAAKGIRILETTGGVLFAGEMGSGKSLWVDEMVLTPSGPMRMGDIRVGDQVMGTDGRPHRVLGVYPQGERELFKVTFSDGSVVTCDDEHLWAVNTPLRRWRGSPGKVVPLREIRQRLVDGAGNRQHFIPVPEPLQLQGTGELPLDPYLLGVLIGDGSTTCQVAITTADEGVLREVERRLPAGARLGANHGYTTNLTGTAQKNPVLKALRDLGLWGKRSWEKHIPEQYLWAPVEARIELLQGLLDTGGVITSYEQSSNVEYTTTSEQVAREVQLLVAGLGGVARITGPRHKTYPYKGEKRYGRASWRVCVSLPDSVPPFKLQRKAEQYRPRCKYQPARAIASVAPSGRGEAVCISVDSPDSCFVLANGVVTHNTTIALALAHELDLWPCLVISPLSAFSTWERQLSEMGRRAYLATDSPQRSAELLDTERYDAVVMSFDRLGAFTEQVERYGFKAVIADEIQRIRTPGSRRSRALRGLAGAVPMRIGLSGTPLTNTVADLLPIGAFLVPGEWRPRANTKDLEDMYPGDPIEAVAEHLGTMMVRRRMVDTGATLPKRNDHRVHIQLTPEQRRALADLEAEAEKAKENGEFDDPANKLHAFVKLQRMRQIINSPAQAGIGGPNPKVRSAVDLAQDFIATGRKGVIFCADRTTFRELGAELDKAGIGWVGIWGSTPPKDRIANEKRFHTDPNIKVVVCTIQAGAESWSASPTGTWLISTAYMYQAAILEQMECRVYRMNSDPDGPEIEIMYIHAQAPGGTLDDRMVEILTQKKALFAQVVDRTVHKDSTKIHYSMGDLVYLLTGNRDDRIDALEADAKQAIDREQARKDHARRTAHAHKKSVRNAADGFHDTGEHTMTAEEWAAAHADDSLDELLEAAEADEGLQIVDDLDDDTDGFELDD